MRCSYARVLSSEGSSDLSEVNLNNFVSSLTGRVPISSKPALIFSPVLGEELVGAV